MQHLIDKRKDLIRQIEDRQKLIAEIDCRLAQAHKKPVLKRETVTRLKAEGLLSERDSFRWLVGGAPDWAFALEAAWENENV